jgi:signal transduction histidine kinase/ActR/RegA family two-component response regulator/HAMP domain-containing protein
MAPALVFLYFKRLPWTGFAIGLLGLVAAWLGGERFVFRQLRSLVAAVQRLAAGELSARTGLAGEPGEIGQLARTFDDMAATLQQRVTEREQAEQRSLNRALQQTAVAALGQFALSSDDFSALLNQAVTLISQTLEVEFCRILELLPEKNAMLFRAGTGWKKGVAGSAVISADPGSQAGFTLQSGEPVVITELQNEKRFQCDSLLQEHRIVSGVSVAIAARGRTFGVLGVYSGRRREFNSDDLQFLLSVANALAVAVDHRRFEAELKKLAEFTQLNPNPAMELTADGTITYFNDAAAKLAQSLGQTHPQAVLPPKISDVLRSCFAAGQGVVRLNTYVGNHTLSWSFHAVAGRPLVHGYVEDITERLNLEAQFRQAQKMESVGQLAAGVAHDFNNMLTVIQGHAGMLMTRPTLPPELRESVQAVSFASERAASLTRQLLLFSRKSVMQPKLLDLREIIGNLTKMLKRLLGESITLEFSPPPEIPFVRGDAGMIEQIIMNLAVNARDAMASRGKLTIDIQAPMIDAGYVQAHPSARTGRFVCLRVSDTGHGMDAQTMNHIFEPFFTTKEAGKGTGLGLATVYGIVKQHEGWIEVFSEVGRGTAFIVFFPASGESAKAARDIGPSATQVRGGNETILMVEDEAAVLALGRMILQDCGYRVLEAASGVQAIEIFQAQTEPIHLLLTDMIMPEGLSGIELAQELRARKPALKVIFTSGYSADDLGDNFIGKVGAGFLQKPYTRTTLAQAVRERLDAAA